jgi:hypothetical protein
MDGLAPLGLKSGDRVRWRQGGGAKWRIGRVSHRERDGSVGVTDDKGLQRSFVVERLEVSTRGPRGGRVWEPLAARANRVEQLRLI